MSVENHIIKISFCGTFQKAVNPKRSKDSINCLILSYLRKGFNYTLPIWKLYNFRQEVQFLSLYKIKCLKM